MLTIADLLRQFPQSGEVVWIGLRPERNATIFSVPEVVAHAEQGLLGDRYHGKGKRQVTFMQWEHLAVISSFLREPVSPEQLRRNLVIKGINLLALKDRTFRLGTAVLQTTGLCQPCSKIERSLGQGAYNAMRGHGGITARIVKSGLIRVGDRLSVIGEVAAGE